MNNFTAHAAYCTLVIHNGFNLARNFFDSPISDCGAARLTKVCTKTNIKRKRVRRPYNWPSRSFIGFVAPMDTRKIVQFLFIFVVIEQFIGIFEKRFYVPRWSVGDVLTDKDFLLTWNNVNCPAFDFIHMTCRLRCSYLNNEKILAEGVCRHEKRGQWLFTRNELEVRPHAGYIANWQGQICHCTRPLPMGEFGYGENDPGCKCTA